MKQCKTNEPDRGGGIMTSFTRSAGDGARDYPRSLPVSEWPDADRSAWEAACRPGSRPKPGGVASRLAPASRDDFATATTVKAAHQSGGASERPVERRQPTTEVLSGSSNKHQRHGSSCGERLGPLRTDDVANRAQYRTILSCFAMGRGRGAIITLYAMRSTKQSCLPRERSY